MQQEDKIRSLLIHEVDQGTGFRAMGRKKSSCIKLTSAALCPVPKKASSEGSGMDCFEIGPFQRCAVFGCLIPAAQTLQTFPHKTLGQTPLSTIHIETGNQDQATLGR